MIQFPALLNCASPGEATAGFSAMYGNYGATLPAVFILAACLFMAYSKPQTINFLSGQLTLFVAALLAVAPVLNMLTVATFGMPFNCSNQEIVSALTYSHVIAWLAALGASIGLVVTISEMITVMRKRPVPPYKVE